MGIFEDFESISAACGRHREAEVQVARAEFQRRTGAFRPEDPWFEARSRAFWDDALTQGGLTRASGLDLGASAAELCARLGRAHRGLFQIEQDERGTLARDAWSGAEFWVDEVDLGMRHALASETGYVDGRILAVSAGRVALLPGALFHRVDATAAIAVVLAAARERRLETCAVLDALLRMDLALATLSRVKVAYAYRPSAL